MLGYVTVEKPELKIREFELYNAYYCGVCKSIGRRYGQAERLVLSYDAAFLALILAGLSDDEDSIEREHCIVHPVRKKSVASNTSIDYAADVMLILFRHKLADDVRDEGRLYNRAALKLTGGMYRKLKERYPGLSERIEEGLIELSELEERKCDSLDVVSEAFSGIMQAVMTEGLPEKAENERKILAQIGYHLGKWIYVIDAYDDLEKDIKSGAYNPLVYRYGYSGEEETPSQFADRIREDTRRNLLLYLSQMGLALDLLELKKNRAVIENIVYMGLLRKTEKILNKETNGEKNG